VITVRDAAPEVLLVTVTALLLIGRAAWAEKAA
jgi:hypothetical protein